MNNLNFTRGQVTNILEGIAKKEEGVQHILKMSIEAIKMVWRDVYNKHHLDISNSMKMQVLPLFLHLALGNTTYGREGAI